MATAPVALDAGVLAARGLYGAVVSTAPGTRVKGPDGTSLEEAAPGTQVVARPPGGPAYRDLTVFLHNSDSELGTHQMPYRHQVIGTQAVSYHRAPDAALLRAVVGDALRLQVVAAVSEQVQSFALDGHRWPLEPGAHGTSVVASEAVGAREVLTVVPVGGAGGEGGRPGDYAYADTRGPYRDAGMHGVLRVPPRGDDGLAALSREGDRTWWPALLVLALGSLVLLRLLGSETPGPADREPDGPAG